MTDNESQNILTNYTTANSSQCPLSLSVVTG